MEIVSPKHGYQDNKLPSLPMKLTLNVGNKILEKVMKHQLLTPNIVQVMHKNVLGGRGGLFSHLPLDRVK